MEIAQEVAPSRRTAAGRPSSLALLGQAVREVWSRRQLIRHLVRSDVKKKGADTLLGNLWWVLDPILQMVVYVVLFSIIFQRAVPDFPLFLFVAILPWKWFSSSIGDAVTAVVGQERLIKQIQFPKLVLPMATTLANVVNFCFGLVPVFVLLIFAYPHHFTLNVLWLPVIAAVQIVFTLSLTLAVAAVNVFYRDVGNLTRHILLLWFYLSPALWSFDRFGPPQSDLARLGLTILHLNPFAILLGSYRTALYGQVERVGSETRYIVGAPVDAFALAALLGASLLLLSVMTVMFKRLEPAFAKIL